MFAGEEDEGLGEGKGPFVDWIAGFRAGAREIMLQPRRPHGSARPIQERRDEKSEFFLYQHVYTFLCLIYFLFIRCFQTPPPYCWLRSTE